MVDKKAIALLKKYYLSYKSEGQPSEADLADAVKSGVFVPDSEMTHDEIVAAVKELSERISLESAAKAFLYSLSSGDMRYRSAVSSLLWAKALPKHELVSNGVEPGGWRSPMCIVCGCTHGLETSENIDWNKFNVFRYLPPKQYGREPDYVSAEYVLNDLREFEKLPAVEPCDDDYRILNGIFACANEMKSHNMDTALVAEIRKRKFSDATGNAIHCILGILSVCGIFQSDEKKGFLYEFTNRDEQGFGRDGLTFFPLNFWRGKFGVNYDAVNKIFGSFSGDKLLPEKAAAPEKKEEAAPKKKALSKVEQYFKDRDHCIMLTDDERRYLALDPIDKSWETECIYSALRNLRKRIVMFYDGDTIVKVIEEYSYVNEDTCVRKGYCEFDTHLKTDKRTMILPLTDRGRAKPITPTNLMAIDPFGCEVDISIPEEGTSIWAGNRRNSQVLNMGETERIKKIQNDSDFHEFMQYYISTCPDDYFQRIAEIRGLKHQTVKFKAGDIFRCREDREHYTYGLILGKTREIEKWDELPKEHSFRHLMTQPIIVRMYDFVTTDKDMTAQQLKDMPLCPPKICSDGDIIWGRHKIVDHKELVPDDIEFCIHLTRIVTKNEHVTPFTAEMFLRENEKKGKKSREPMSLYIEWGFVSMEIPWADVPDDIRDMVEERNWSDGGVSLGISGAYCGMTLTQLLKKHPRHIYGGDLHYPENRERFDMVMDFLGLPKGAGYDYFAEKYGGISRQKYIELIGERSK
ncbi:MAG: immunity 26/phosphotriesterase HocA family protein [Ruminococcus sp.]|uniref:immunity 26/phosphotriesterase HocA family protein n=1 Tax=Ruminococcus sp. TaxID=41978 RepID=UPI0025FB98E9|nr:immunity 26/phosphotriesterase HocA family protein [Ruminococcus sp.]MBO4865763.1 immunity 26/phosphotriesterase HocA family protein [Ruminococcus sp.]